jgi:hypothetical protein
MDMSQAAGEEVEHMLKLISALTIALRLYISILTLLKIQEKR